MIQHARRMRWAVLGVPALVLGLAGPGRAAPPEPASTTCAACHGPDGNATNAQYPKLAGQKAGYLALQLQAFRSGERASAVMKPLAQNLTNAQIGELARYYAAQRETSEQGPVAPDARRGAAIFRSACALCHAPGGFRGGMMGGGMMGGRMTGGGMMGGGMMMRTNPAITPNLFAQHAAYLARQLDAFASGARAGSVMGPIARNLSRRDRRAVADYLSSVR